MDVLNRPIPTSDSSINTGIAKGKKLKLDEITGFIIVFDGFKIPKASRSDFAEALSYLQSKTIAADKYDRAYPITKLYDFTDETADPEEKTDGYGDLVGMVEQPVKFSIMFPNHGIEFHKNMRNANAYDSFRAYGIARNMICGYANSDGDLLPFEMNMFINRQKIGKTTGDLTMLPAKLSFRDPKAFSTRLDVIEIPEDTDLENELNGVIDLVLSSPALNVVVVEEKGTMTNLYDKFGSVLSQKSNWEARDAVTKVAITLTTVTTSPAHKGFAFTYPSNPNPVEVRTVDPEALATSFMGSATAGGYESDGWCRLGE